MEGVRNLLAVPIKYTSHYGKEHSKDVQGATIGGLESWRF